MKAEPRRRNHVIGSKWLRQGGQTHGNKTATETENRVADRNSEIGAVEKSNPLILGEGIVTTGVNELQGDGDNLGSDNAKRLGLINQTAGYFSKESRAGNLSLDHGLNIVDPKRRRVDEIISDETGPKQAQLDIAMIDSQEDISQNQKNGQEADVARQPRLEL